MPFWNEYRENRLIYLLHEYFSREYELMQNLENKFT